MSVLKWSLTFFMFLLISEKSFSTNFDKESVISFSIYQNREEGYLKVRLYQPLEQKMRITVYNNEGNQYYLSYLVVSANSAISVDISYFEPGVYQICVENNDNESSREIIID
jgi:Domain of unknown function (DUF3244)